MKPVVNISTYKFTPLSELKPLRDELLMRCQAEKLKGTILLSTEGINLFVAGEKDSIDQLIDFLRTIPGLEDLTPKISESDHQPFTRMLVKIKQEIISFGVPGISPATYTSRKIAPQELKRWLDEGRPVTLLDTRNDYEVKLGTFRHAIPAGIRNFREFPSAVAKLDPQLKQQPIVMFCTGGIRCEKAGPFMEREGFHNLFQLDGGILKYFEECGGEHYDGECFVFDQRVGVDPTLHESENTQCFACLTPLTVAEQQDSRYVPGKSCPYCYQSPLEQMQASIAQRMRHLQQLIYPLPGSTPYVQVRPLKVSAHHAGLTMLEYLCTVLPHIPVEEWQHRISASRILNKDQQPVQHDRIVRAGERYLQFTPQHSEPDVNANFEIVYEDATLIVIDKSAPLPVHPCGRFNRNTLQYFLGELYRPQKPRPAHRLDAHTTGLIVFSRTRHAAGMLQPQFEKQSVQKVYLARIQGHPNQTEFICTAPISAEPGPSGSRNVSAQGLPAQTKFHVLNQFPDGTSLVQAELIEHGRTHQIRVHLWELGMPVVGDQIYQQQRTIVESAADSGIPMYLHSWKMKFHHPVTNQECEFISKKPTWAE